MRKAALLLLLISLASVLLARPAGATPPTAPAVPELNPPGRQPPPGFSLIASAPGAELYRKDYPGGSPDFVQVVDLGRGGGVRLLHAPVAAPGSGEGVYGGDNPSFARQSLGQSWSDFSAGEQAPFCLVNGGFFSTDADPTPLAFPLKIDGRVITDGYALDEFPDQKLILELWPDRADITPLSEEALYTSSAPDILAGLSESADKGLENETGRTFAGVSDADGDGNFDQLLIFASATASQPHAAGMLRAFGAAKVIMLDGGGSTQLICEGVPLIPGERSLPQTIGVTASAPPPLAFQVTAQPLWPILVEGERLDVEVILQNTGSETWRSDQDLLVNAKNPWGAEEVLPLPADVPPYEQAVFTWRTDRFQHWGVFESQWRLERGGEVFAGEAVRFNVIVLPKSLADKKDALAAQIRAWLAEEAQDIGELALKWIEGQLQNAIQTICLPGAALPVGLVFLVAWRKHRRPG